MTWYAAHLVLYVRFKDRRQTHFPVWENIVLVQAASEDEAFARAEERGREESGDDDATFRWEGRPSSWVFAGVRKLTLCQEEHKRPGNGTEVTYLEMELPSRDALRRFMSGRPTRVKMCDGFPEPALTNAAASANGPKSKS